MIELLLRDELFQRVVPRRFTDRRLAEVETATRHDGVELFLYRRGQVLPPTLRDLRFPVSATLTYFLSFEVARELILEPILRARDRLSKLASLAP